MRSGSPELEAALEAGERRYTASVRLGGRDVTDQVTSWQVDRAYETGLPDQVAAPVGSDSAQAKMTLTGTGGSSAAQLYSPWAPRATADVTRPGQSAVLSWGLANQNMQTLRGRLKSVQATARSGAVDVSALDGAELLRGPAWLPPAGETLNNRTHAQWVIDHALRSSGIYTSPPERAGAIFFASLQAGFQANRGMLLSRTGNAGFRPARSPWTAGPGASQFDEYAWWTATWAPQRRVLSQVNQLMVEWWFYRRTTSDSPETRVELVFANQPENVSGYSPWRVSVSYNPATRRMSATSTGGSAHVWTLPTTVDQAGRFKIAFQIGLTGTSDPVTVRGWLYQPSGDLYTSSTYSGGAPGWGVLEKVSAEGTGPMECLGVTPVSGTVQIVQPWRRGAVIDLMTSGGVNAGFDTYGLTSLPEVSGTWWDMLKQIAADTMSYMGFDEDGLFWFRRYEYIQPGRPAVPDLEVTSRRDIADLTVSEEIDGVRNRVEVAVSSTRVSVTPSEQYNYTAVTSVNGGSTARVQFDFQQRPWQIRTPMIFTAITIPSGNLGSLVKMITANGQLAPVEIEMRYDEGNPVVIYHNRGSSTAYSALRTSLDEPSLRLAHGTGTDARQSPRTRENTASVARFGRQALSVAASPWVQNWVFADNLALQLIEWTAWPIPMTGQVEILPDPRIQLGDVVRVVDPGGVRVDRLFRVLGYRVSGSGGEVRMTVDLRPIEIPDQPQDVGLVVEPVLDPAVAEQFPG